MPRLISADRLEADMYHNAFEIDTDLQKWDSGCWIRYKMFENVIDAQPTVEAEPIRHGRWIRYEALNGIDVGCECSICGFHSNVYDSRFGYKYCPNCGAKMDGEKDV